MKITMRHILLLGFLSLVLSACEIGLAPDVIPPPPPPQSLVAPSAAQIQALLQAPATAEYCMEPGYAWGCITIDECTAVNVTDIVYEMTGLPAWLTFDPDTRELCLSIGSAVVPAHTGLISVTYTCYSASDPTVTASRNLNINDCDGGGYFDGGEDANSAVPALTRDGDISLTLRNVDEYFPPGAAGGLTKIRSNLVYPLGTGMDVFVDDDSGDMDGDGIINIDDPAVFIRTSDSTLTGGTLSHPVTVNSIVAADLNDDSSIDIVVGTDFGFVTSYLNDGSGNLTFAFNSPFFLFGVLNTISDMAAAVFKPNAFMGIAFTAPADNRVIIAGGDQLGFFKWDQTIPFPGSDPRRIVTADYNGDTFPDIAVVEANNLHVYLNNGAGAMVLANTYATCNAVTDLGTADMDADGNMDIAMTCNPAERVWTFFGLGTGAFGVIGSYATGGEPMGLTVADFDLDGNLDFGIGSTSAGEDLQVILCNGNRTCQAVRTFDVHAIRNVVGADLNGDGYPDIAGVGGAGLHLFINDGTGLAYTEITYDLGGPNGIQSNAVDLTGDNIIDLVNTNTNGGGLQNINIWLQ